MKEKPEKLVNRFINRMWLAALKCLALSEKKNLTPIFSKGVR